MMVLELHEHDTNTGPFSQIKDIKFVHEADMWVDETSRNLRAHRWVLKDGNRVVKVWERSSGPTGTPVVIGP